ncbi:hypothetical protein ACFZBC_08905 [Streptomyces luteogriseus]|uniref:hypothetical protein n=1 Tax=Streptomyces luteogriseus TaxID=68233 RepID=UPI0036E6DF98
MTTDRQLNWCGISTETIAAEYETDAALAEAGMDMADPYFLAAFAAEDEQRSLDYEAAAEAQPVEAWDVPDARPGTTDHTLTQRHAAEAQQDGAQS